MERAGAKSEPARQAEAPRVSAYLLPAPHSRRIPRSHGEGSRETAESNIQAVRLVSRYLPCQHVKLSDAEWAVLAQVMPPDSRVDRPAHVLPTSRSRCHDLGRTCHMAASICTVRVHRVGC